MADWLIFWFGVVTGAVLVIVAGYFAMKYCTTEDNDDGADGGAK